MKKRLKPLPPICHCGTYMIRCGEFFYIGSSLNLMGRRADHRRKLVDGEHHNKALQDAFDACGTFECDLIDMVSPRDFPSNEAMIERLREMEQALLDKHHGGQFCCNRSSTAIGATNDRPEMVKKWQDPEFREQMAQMSRIRKGRLVSNQTREKMSAAKLGSKNPKSRPVWTEFQCVRQEFASGSEAAIHFGVSQQLMESWMKGRIVWPGAGRTPSSDRAKELVGLRGGYL